MEYDNSTLLPAWSDGGVAVVTDQLMSTVHPAEDITLGANAGALRGPMFHTPLIRMVTEAYIWIWMTSAIILNISLLFSILRVPEQYTPFYATLCCLSVCDVIQALFMAPENLAVIYNDGHPLSEVGCEALRAVRLSFVFYQSYGMLFLAIERVFFFYRPFLYTAHVTIEKVIILHFFGLVVSSLFSTVVLSKAQDTLSVPTLTCLSYVPYFNELGFAMFYAPNGIGNMICVWLMVRLLLKHKRAIAIQRQIIAEQTAAVNVVVPLVDVEAQSNPVTAEVPLPASNLDVGSGPPHGTPLDGESGHSGPSGAGPGPLQRPPGEPRPPGETATHMQADTQIQSSIKLSTAIRLVLCTNASFWCTTLPASMVIVGMRWSGIDQAAMDNGLGAPLETNSYRFAIQFLVASTYANPLIHFYYNTPLRQSFCQGVPCLRRCGKVAPYSDTESV